MRFFCTLFDKNYLFKGLTLLRSLERTHPDPFLLWVLCMDDLTYDVLSKMNLKHANLIRFEEFKTEKLLELKKERAPAEFSWTCTASLCAYMLEKKNVDEITYLDADLYFFSGSQEVFDEIGNSSIAIIEHRFSPERKYLEYKGKYNVSWVTFKNDVNGREAAFWWRDKVLEWCYNRYEKGKFGDQLYLNDWETRFQNVHVIQHPNAGIAPWNIFSFGNGVPIFYHFHGLHLLANGLFLTAGNYYIPRHAMKNIYEPYIEELRNIIILVNQYDDSFHFGYRNLSFADKLRRPLFSSRFSEKIFLLIMKLMFKLRI